MATLTIPTRFCGPADSGNGGYTCGALASHVDAPTVEVTLHSPPPLATPMDVVMSDDSARLMDGDTLVAEATAVEPLADDLPRPVALDEAARASARFPAYEDHNFPTCFTCGPRRPEGDGLEVWAGPTEAGDQVASPWTPEESLLTDDGLVGEPYVWAALDCPGFFAAQDMSIAALLGRMAGTVHRRPEPGEDLVVCARTTGTEGRKRHATTAVFDEHGTTLASSRQTWIVID